MLSVCPSIDGSSQTPAALVAALLAVADHPILVHNMMDSWPGASFAQLLARHSDVSLNVVSGQPVTTSSTKATYELSLAEYARRVARGEMPREDYGADRGSNMGPSQTLPLLPY